MGASVWQREGAAGAGKTFTSGVVASPPRNAQRPGKRKLIWKREGQQDNGDASQPACAASHEAKSDSKKPRLDPTYHDQRHGQADTLVHSSTGAGGSKEQAWQTHAAPAHQKSTSNGLAHPKGASQHQQADAGRKHGHPGQDGNAPSAGTAVQQQGDAQNPAEQLRQLKQKIAARQAQLQREQAAAKAQAEAEKRQKDDMIRRRSRLQASMAEAFREAQDAMVDAAAKSAPGGTTAGDDKEVARVLRARDDYEVLRLSPGCTLTALKKRYREMAVVLHPDKCTVARATDAFQRLMTAYQNILKLLA